jgi:protocatechuate 3,4-dioxygenase beta subunit
MNSRRLVVALLVVVAALVACVFWLTTKPEEIVEVRKIEQKVVVGTTSEAPAAKKRTRRSESNAKWERLGQGTVVGVVREYSSEKPIEGVEVTLEAGLPGPDQILHAKTRADGGFTFEKVTNFDAWMLRAKSSSPSLADAELAGVAVIENRATNLGTVYLAPAFGVPGTVVDEKDAPVAGAVVRAIRARPASGAMDILRLIRELPVRPTAVDTATSADSGKFELRKVPPGRYDFTVEKAGYQLKVELGTIVTPDASNHPLRFVMARGFQADGIVKREGGGSVAGLPVVAFVEPGKMGANLSAIDKVLAATDEKGAFHFDGLGSGRYVVAVSPEGEPSVVAPNVTIPTKSLIEINLKGDAWLEGKVTGDGDAPIVGAQVYAINFDSKSPTIGNVRTDASGQYVIRGLSSGPLQLFLVQADGYGNYPDDLSGLMGGKGGKGATDVKLVPGKNEKSVSLVKGGTVRGVVKEKDSGAPIAGARVTLGSMLALFGGSRETTTDAEGKFEIASVPKGTAILMVSKEGWFQPGVNQQSLMMVIGSQSGRNAAPAVKDSGKGATIVVSEPGELIERTLELAHGSTLSGIVSTPDGVAVAGAQVSLVLEGGGGGMSGMLAGLFPTPDPRLTDAQGRFEMPGPAPGEKARVVARATGYLDGRSDPVSSAAGGSITDVAVKLRTGATVSGRVHDEQGKPIEGAYVRWTAMSDDPNDWNARWRLRNATPSVTDGKGEFRAVNVETGKLVVEAGESRRLPWTKKDVVAEEGKPLELDVTLTLGAVIEGQVVGVDGRPCAAADVRWTKKSADGQQRDPFVDTNGGGKSDDAGAFKLEGLVPGQYELTASVAGAAPSEPQTVASGASAVTLQLTPAFSITGIVRTKAGDGVSGVDVQLNKRVATKDGGPGEGFRSVQYARTNAAGEFEFKDVPGGTYDVRASAGNWNAGPRPNIVSTTVKDVLAGKQGLVIECESGLTITASVYGEDGQLVADGWAWGAPADAKGPSDGVNAQIDSGKFELTGLQPGKYRLNVGSGSRQKVVVVDAGTKDLRIDFGGGGSIRVHVTSDGGSAAGIRVGAWSEAGGGQAVTDADGRCEIKSLAEGPYTVQAGQSVGDANFHGQQAGVNVRVGAAVDVELRLQKLKQ